MPGNAFLRFPATLGALAAGAALAAAAAPSPAARAEAAAAVEAAPAPEQPSPEAAAGAEAQRAARRRVPAWVRGLKREGKGWGSALQDAERWASLDLDERFPDMQGHAVHHALRKVSARGTRRRECIGGT